MRKSEEEPSVQEEVKPPPASSEASARTEFFEEATKALKIAQAREDHASCSSNFGVQGQGFGGFRSYDFDEDGSRR